MIVLCFLSLVRLVGRITNDRGRWSVNLSRSDARGRAKCFVTRKVRLQVRLTGARVLGYTHMLRDQQVIREQVQWLFSTDTISAQTSQITSDGSSLSLPFATSFVCTWADVLTCARYFQCEWLSRNGRGITRIDSLSTNGRRLGFLSGACRNLPSSPFLAHSVLERNCNCNYDETSYSNMYYDLARIALPRLQVLWTLLIEACRI